MITVQSITQTSGKYLKKFRGEKHCFVRRGHLLLTVPQNIGIGPQCILVSTRYYLYKQYRFLSWVTLSYYMSHNRRGKLVVLLHTSSKRGDKGENFDAWYSVIILDVAGMWSDLGAERNFLAVSVLLWVHQWSVLIKFSLRDSRLLLADCNTYSSGYYCGLAKYL